MKMAHVDIAVGIITLVTFFMLSFGMGGPIVQLIWLGGMGYSAGNSISYGISKLKKG